MQTLGTIEGLFIGKPKTLQDERGAWISSIYRDPVPGPVPLTFLGLEGDKVTQPFHGGPGAAVCVHPSDHYRFWNAQYGMDLRPGAVGENITVTDIEEESVCIGDIIRLGSAVVQVSCPRIPCGTLVRRIGRRDWVALTLKENRTGFYLRVLEVGELRQGAEWILLERLHEDASIAAVNRCFHHVFDLKYAESLLNLMELDDFWKKKIAAKRQKYLEEQSSRLPFEG